MQKQIRMIIVALLLVGIASTRNAPVRNATTDGTNPAIIAGDELKGGSGTGRT